MLAGNCKLVTVYLVEFSLNQVFNT